MPDLVLVEEKQKLYLNAKTNNEEIAKNNCWRETKVVFKYGNVLTEEKKKVVEEKQKLYLNITYFPTGNRPIPLKRNKSCI